LSQLFTFEKLNNVSVETAVKIHTAAFPNFFLTSLGNQVLAVFYRALMNDKATIAWTTLAETKIIGFMWLLPSHLDCILEF